MNNISSAAQEALFFLERLCLSTPGLTLLNTVLIGLKEFKYIDAALLMSLLPVSPFSPFHF